MNSCRKAGPEILMNYLSFACFYYDISISSDPLSLLHQMLILSLLLLLTHVSVRLTPSVVSSNPLFSPHISFIPRFRALTSVPQKMVLGCLHENLFQSLLKM